MNIKYRAVFCKKGDLVFISHLDLMTLFRRAIRRSGLPFFLTEGFSPRVKISMPKALKLGVESETEEITFWLTENIPLEVVKSTINSCLPGGIEFLTVSY